MKKGSRNYSGIFRLFANDKPDKTGEILGIIGKIGFTTSFIGMLLGGFFRDDSIYTNIAYGMFGIGFIVGILMFIATGVHYSGREKGMTNFISSLTLIFKNTFLFLFLPVIIITLAVVIWAIITKQPAFQ